MQRVMRVLCAGAGGWLWWYGWSHDLKWLEVAIFTFSGFMLNGVENFTWSRPMSRFVSPRKDGDA